MKGIFAGIWCTLMVAVICRAPQKLVDALCVALVAAVVGHFVFAPFLHR